MLNMRTCAVQELSNGCCFLPQWQSSCVLWQQRAGGANEADRYSWGLHGQ